MIAGPKPQSAGKRLREWFWRGAALAEKRRTLPAPTERALGLEQRARTSAELALNCQDFARGAEVERSAVTPAETPESLAGSSTCELYRQSVYWALCALAARSDDSAGSTYDEANWNALDERDLSRAATSEERVASLRSSLRNGSFVYFAELPSVEQLALAGELKKLSDLLLARLNERTLALQGVVVQRAARLLLLLLLLLVVVGLGVWERKTRDARRDLAEGKPWQASSKLDNVTCVSPNQTCAEATQFFFHTAEEKDPTIEFDLGSVQKISAVQVDNRLDSFKDRAIPLIVEVSENHKRWKQVARENEEFSTWRASFPKAKARWVRLRAHKVTFLHLSRVRILP